MSFTRPQTSSSHTIRATRRPDLAGAIRLGWLGLPPSAAEFSPYLTMPSGFDSGGSVFFIIAKVCAYEAAVIGVGTAATRACARQHCTYEGEREFAPGATGAKEILAPHAERLTLVYGEKAAP